MTNRNETRERMEAFSKPMYFKEELPAEYRKLEKEMINIVFGEQKPSNNKLTLWDVEKFLDEKNEMSGHVADDEIKAFEYHCKQFKNRIAASISGETGEKKVVDALRENCSPDVLLLSNIEMKNEERRTELDVIAITEQGITIFEVKNTKKGVFIDEKGNYNRVGRYLGDEGNILGKMKFREELVQNALLEAGIENVPIQSVLVFTDRRAKVENHCTELETCYVCRVSSIAEAINETGEVFDSKRMYDAILAKKNTDAYPVAPEIEFFKESFINVMCALDSEQKKPTVCKEVSVSEMENIRTNNWRNIPAAAITLLSGVIAATAILMTMPSEIKGLFSE